jgi:hypothetical protein
VTEPPDYDHDKSLRAVLLHQLLNVGNAHTAFGSPGGGLDRLQELEVLQVAGEPARGRRQLFHPNEIARAGDVERIRLDLLAGGPLADFSRPDRKVEQ